MKITVLVATHKEYRMPDDPMYLPIQAGRACSDIQLPYTPDNTGTNISEKNPTYCELTVLYYAWKNLDADAIGLVHYRRYFSTHHSFPWNKDRFSSVLKSKEAEALLESYDAVLPKKRNYFIETTYSHYIHAHPAEPLEKIGHLIQNLCPEYSAAFSSVMKSSKGHRFNMLLMKKEWFDSYCEWLFSLLFSLEQELDISSYDDYNKRVYGFLAERLLDVYVTNHNLHYTELPVCFMEKEHWIKKGTAFLKRKWCSLPKR